MNPPDRNCPSAGTEGLRTAVGANAEAEYSTATAAHQRALSTRIADVPPAPGSGRTVFRALSGREWAYTGKRARVLRMLGSGRSITQWDCLPWHTRLGSTIHAMREDGLAIDTAREGEFGHARYTLQTAGQLVERDQ